MNRLKRFFGRREVLGVFLVLFLIFGFYSLKLMNAHPYTVSRENVGSYVQEGRLESTAILKPNTLYGSTMTGNQYPIPLVKGLEINYTYRTTPALSKGKYTLTMRVDYYVNKGSEEVTLWKEEVFRESGELKNGSFSVVHYLNMDELNNRSAEVSNELGVKRLKKRITITATVVGSGNMYGSDVNTAFTHEVGLVRDGTSELYYFTDPVKTSKKTISNTVTNTVSASILGVESSVGTAKTVTTTLTLLMLAPILGYVAINRGKRKKKDELKKVRGYIVEGTPSNVKERVILRKPEDVIKTFELVDRPILHYIEGNHEVYSLIDGEIAYEYREPLPPAEKKDN